MLWKKAWKECWCRLVLCGSLTVACMMAVWVPIADKLSIDLGHLDATGLGRLWKAYFLLFCAISAPVGALILAGSGVNTQTVWGISAGFHPSTYFLLGLPVSRTQLLRVRVLMGWILTVLWAAASVILFGLTAMLLGGSPSWETWLGQLLHLLVVASMTYSLAVWTSSFLDELWSGTVSLFITSMLGGYAIAGGPGWLNVFRYIDSQAILTGGQSAWLQTITYLAVSAGFYALAAWVVERKEY